ncbi:MAG: type II toxin-antitoxin system VapC family toxin [Proteobacteria bacterium]|nr:type II toxin-antitoxin system VapC family toxin [Pseudomonadota bacterium]
MKVLVDTSVLIDHLRGRAPAAELLMRSVRAGAALWSATVVRTEILAGMRESEERATNALLGALRWQDLTIEIANHAGRLARRYLRSHPGVDTVDYVVAATALTLGASLLTQNVKHFPMFDGLRPAY